MKELFSLGHLYPSDFLKEGENPRSEKVELKLIMDDDGLVRLEKTAPMNQMYGKYWYRSGINKTMKAALRDVVESILKIQPISRRDIWLDIACNDGTLLSYVPFEFNRVGYDPADDTYRIESEKHADMIVQDFFTAESFRDRLGDSKAKVITSIAMFYDVPDPNQFCKEVYDILEDDGLWVMQLSYSPLMLRQNAFDNICHEHIYYYSLTNIHRLLRKNRFKVVDCELNEVNGGSFRVYIRKDTIKQIHDVPYMRTLSLFELEESIEIENPDMWIEWFKKIELLKKAVTDLIMIAKSSGKSIWAYGASTKGNTLLQYFGLDSTMIDAIADRNQSKHGLVTVGTNIPIKSEEEMREAQPDYLLILPWHFEKEFIEREKDYLRKGGKMIFPCPVFKIVSYEDVK